MKILLRAVLVVSILLTLILVYRTAQFKSRQIKPVAVSSFSVDENRITRNLSRALQFRTISHQDPKQTDPAPFVALRRHLEETYPLVHSRLERELISDHSLLFTWRGQSQDLKPALLMAHLDVVPAEEQTWTLDPFSGTIQDGYIWGRGALDDKSNVVAILEATEKLLQENAVPKRTLYLAFGHDEEVSGLRGAGEIATLLESRGAKLEFVLDEGMMITEGLVPGVTKPVALIGTAEKGFLTVRLTVEGKAGHSSAPPKHTAIGILSEAITQLESASFSPSIKGAPRQMFEYIGPEQQWGKRLVMANLWLFEPVLELMLTKSEGTNALVRTTAAVTIIQGGVKENVLPQQATALVNFRIATGQTAESVMSHVRDAIKSKAVQITNENQGVNPSAISSTDTFGFNLIHTTIRQVFPDVLVSPSLLTGATDSRYFTPLSPHIYRFSPFRITREDTTRFHGADERISVTDFAGMVRFYVQLIRNTTM